MQNLSRQGGIALLEALVALAILAIGVSSYMRWYSTITKNTQRTLKVIEQLDLQQEIVAQLSSGLIKAGQQTLYALGEQYQLVTQREVISQSSDRPAGSLGKAPNQELVRWVVKVQAGGELLMEPINWVRIESTASGSAGKLQ